MGGAGATAAGNELYNLTKPAYKKGKHWNDGLGFGVTLGALAPFMSGEAFVTAAADVTGEEGVAVISEGGAKVFSALTGAVNAIGEAMDPEATHGFWPSEESNDCECSHYRATV